MEYIIDGFYQALILIKSFDEEIRKIVLLSVAVSYAATIIACFISIPVGIFLGTGNYKFKSLIKKVLYTLMGVPTVIVGLVVAMLFSRKGPLGYFDLMFTPYIMIIGQVILVIPLIISLAFSTASTKGEKIRKLGLTLGANKLQIIGLMISELKIEMVVIFVTAFSRAISEVGTVMIVGGNIKGHTRVMTTAIAMFNSMGDYAMAIALGIILILIAFANNSLIIFLESRLKKT